MATTHDASSHLFSFVVYFLFFFFLFAIIGWARSDVGLLDAYHTILHGMGTYVDDMTVKSTTQYQIKTFEQGKTLLSTLMVT